MKEVKRGYVKWEDEDGFHKEPLYDHADLLAGASDKNKLAAEEAHRLNDAAESHIQDAEDEKSAGYATALEALKSAPSDVLTTDDLTQKGDSIVLEADAKEVPANLQDSDKQATEQHDDTWHADAVEK